MASRESKREDDVTRVAREIAGRLNSLGIALTGRESPDDLERIAEAVEEFEAAVEGQGGDLMMDEPPRGGRAQPDSPRFALPRRADGEAAGRYVERLERAAEEIRGGPSA